MNRRELMKLAPAALAVGVAPASALALKSQGVSGQESAAVRETPIAALHREWTAIHRYLNTSDHGLTDPAWDALHAKTWRICDRIMDLPAECPGDVMAKVLVFTCDGDHELPSKTDNPMFWAETRAMVEGTL